MVDKLDGIIISELLVDNPDGGHDTDGDGVANKSDEFIEIQNTTGSAISLDGYELWSEHKGFLYSFGVGDVIDPGSTATVVSQYNGTEPPGYYDAGAAEGTNWLPDGEGPHFDTIFLVNTTTGEYILVSYGDPPQTPTLPPRFPGTTQVGFGERIASTGPNGTAFSRDANGNFVEAAPNPGTPGVVCYAAGTLIETLDGPRRVEDLRPGDQVRTLDSGVQDILWVRSDLRALETADPNAKPVLIRAGAFGGGIPDRDLIVSPQHRILVGGQGVLRDRFAAEVFVPAKSLTSLPGIRHMQGRKKITWVHFACMTHEIVVANGCLSESLLLGPTAINALTARERGNIARLFAPKPSRDAALNGPPARACLSVGEARRHLGGSRGRISKHLRKAVGSSDRSPEIQRSIPRRGHPASSNLHISAQV